MEQNINIEEQIIKAARELFLRKGYKETNMTDIAKEVGLTRPAIHYYFRTKERLFQAIFGDILEIILPKLRNIIISDVTLKEKVTEIVDIYISILSETPDIPLFIIKEIHRDLDNIFSTALSSNIHKSALLLKESVEKEISSGRIKNIPIVDICYTLYGLIIIPILAKPLGEEIFNTKISDKEFIDRWKQNVVNQLVFLLTP